MESIEATVWYVKEISMSVFKLNIALKMYEKKLTQYDKTVAREKMFDWNNLYKDLKINFPNEGKKFDKQGIVNLTGKI